MNRRDFRELCGRGILRLDGATGTELAKQGLPAGVSPEGWVREHPASIAAVQRAYVAAGTQLVYSCTFGGNRLKLKEFGLEGELRELNRDLAAASRKAVGKRALVFGDLGPTGQFTAPIGAMAFDETVAVYREQAEALLEGGVDGFAIETMMDLQEARAACLAVREVAPDIAVIVTMTFDAEGRTLAGNSPVSALVTMQALGADAFGCNCSTGPAGMAKLIAAMKPYAKVPLVAKPNAGLPQLRDGKTVFSMGPEAFAEEARQLVAAGAGIVGGCCGTTPGHIAALGKRIEGASAPLVGAEVRGVVASPRAHRVIAPEAPFALIGERLNPTGKKALQAALRAGDFALVEAIAAEECAAGAALLDVNVGMSGIDEVATMETIVDRLAVQSEAPLCIDTTNPAVAEAALRRYPGRALFNSISAEKSRLEEVLPIAAKYGAMLIVLPLTEAGIPKTAEGRLAAAEEILAAASKYGYTPEECCVDGLVMTVSAEPEAANVTLSTIRECRRRGWNTVCGLSNVSFGLPRRELANRAFLGMAIGNGLNAAIANPCLPDIMDMVRAGDALRGADAHLERYLASYAGTKAAAAPAEAAALTPREAVRQAVLSGNASGIGKLAEAALASGVAASALMDEVLIPAITEVGDRFERKEYFLPQLLRSADAMRSAMEVLQPILLKARGDAPSAGKIILATVKGDIHDIGKNIVALMLRNYNFQVIDLGKDVPAEEILDAAVREDCRVIGLSALMTTTMGQMKTVVELAKKRGLIGLKFIIGGAVVDEHYAQEIGAAYAADALATVKLAQEASKDTP